MHSLREIFDANGAGDVDLEALVRVAGQELFHYARVLTGSEGMAEDCLQDLMVTVLQQRARLREIRDPRAWLFTVIRNRALDYRRKSKLELARGLAEAVEADPGRRLILEEALEALGPREQEIVLLHLWEGLTFAEIAEVLGIARGTALSCYHRSLVRLRARFGLRTVRSARGVPSHA
jgi:RNA polymerase sigma-70 factor (ECF subfamily)